MSNFKLGGRKYKGNAPEPILTEVEWGVSLSLQFLGITSDRADVEP